MPYRALVGGEGGHSDLQFAIRKLYNKNWKRGRGEEGRGEMQEIPCAGIEIDEDGAESATNILAGRSSPK